MSRDVSSHRLGAYLYGLLSGIGLTLLLWGVASISYFPSRNVSAFAAIILLGVSLLAFGGCREAYLRGSLSTPYVSATAGKNETPVEIGTQELVLCEKEPQNQA